MLHQMNRLTDGTMVREEPFGFFLAFPDGDMGYYKPLAYSLIRLATELSVPKAWFFPYRTNRLEDPKDPNWNYALNHPLIVSLELTLKCNCSCQLCYINAGEPRPNEMSHEQLRKVWQQLVKSKVCCVQLTGGEPLLHPLFLEAIDYLHSNGVVVSVITNGTLLTKEIIKKFPRSDFGMGLSIDSYTDNQKIRGRLSSFEFLEPKIKLLREEGVPFNLVVTLSKLNIDEVLPLIEWCRKNDVMLDTLEAQPLGRAYINSHLLLNEDDLLMDAVVYRAKEELEDEYEARHDRLGRFFGEFLQASYLYASLTDRCMGAKTIAYIASDGTLFPCSNCASIGAFPAGNVVYTPFEQLWRKGFSDMRSISWKDFKDCQKCRLSRLPYFCPTRCPALSYVQTGEFTNPGCTPYIKGAVLQRTRIHDEMHAAQENYGNSKNTRRII